MNGKLTYTQFKVLRDLQGENADRSPEAIAERCALSPVSVSESIQALRDLGYLESDQITENGQSALEPYRVKNAIIMAAGTSSRLAPLSYERPKGLMNVRGEILVEREIRQLQEAGIQDITLVVGYMKEQFFYLADKMGVEILINEDYYRYNNSSTLMLVLDKLDNTFICSSDNYFTENVFEPFVYDSYYAGLYSASETEEYCLTTDEDGRIRSFTVGGGPDAWYMLGHVYFSHRFSDRFKELFREEYQQNPVVRTELWEHFLQRHFDDLPIYLRKYKEGSIHEFDSLEELRCFDEHYLNNTDSKIFHNITETLHCTESEIAHIVPLKNGMTNMSFRFTVGEQVYVYRHPGAGSSAFIDRKSEAFAMTVAREMGWDDTLIAMDPTSGWKISRFIPQARPMDYHNEREVKRALAMMRQLHDAQLPSSGEYGVWDEAKRFVERIRERGRNRFEGFDDLYADMECLFQYTEKDIIAKRLCHGDCQNQNYLIDEDERMWLIDWEYTRYDDPGCDYGTFICCSDYSEEEVLQVLDWYYGHPMDEKEKRHSLAYVALVSYYWFVWGIYQDSLGRPVGNDIFTWYKRAKDYGKEALHMYSSDKA